MAQKSVNVLVEVLDCVDEQNAIASASAYLAYADQSDTYGYNPTITNTRVFSNSNGPTAVEISFLSVLHREDEKEFMDEMAKLTKVMSVEWDSDR